MPPSSQNCPKCWEANSPQAVICWSCYTPLSAEKRLEVAAKERRQKLWRGIMEAVPTTGIIFLFGASGWVPRQYGSWFLAAAIGGAVLSLLKEGARYLHKRITPVAKPVPTPERPLILDHGAITNGAALADEEPIIRIAGTVLLYAITDGADSIRLSHGIRGVRVQYHVGSEWLEQMKIPGYVWPPLGDYLWSLPADDIPTDDFLAVFQDETYNMHLVYETDELNEHIIIAITKVDPVPPRSEPA